MMKSKVNKVKEFAKKNGRAISGSLGGASVLVGACIPTFAETTTVDLTSTMTSSLDTVLSNFMTYASIVLPIGLTIFGTVFAVKKGMSFFRVVTGR